MKSSIFTVWLSTLIVVLAITACGADAPPTPDVVAPETGDAPAAVPDSGDSVAIGAEKFADTCAVCHGPVGKGVEGLGKDMTGSEFIAGKTDAELVDFIKTGRPPGDPLNTTGVAMPPFGGNSSLTEAELLDIVHFIRSIQTG